MAGIKELAIYKNKVCGQCGYSWDFPIVRENMLTPIQKLYYFEINECQTCFCIGIDITQVGEFELAIQNEKGYKAIKETRNIPFSFVYKKEAYEYALYAYICERKGDILSYAKAYVMAANIERVQREKYIQSLSYDSLKDAELLSKSERCEFEYLKNAQNALEKIVSENLIADNIINTKLLLAYVYLLLGNANDKMQLLNEIARKKLTDDQVLAVREIAGVKK